MIEETSLGMQVAKKTVAVVAWVLVMPVVKIRLVVVLDRKTMGLNSSRPLRSIRDILSITADSRAVSRGGALASFATISEA